MLVRYSNSINSDELYRLTRRVNLLSYFSLIDKLQVKLGNVYLDVDQFFLLIGGRRNICDEYLAFGPQKLYTKNSSNIGEASMAAPVVNRHGIIISPGQDSIYNSSVPDSEKFIMPHVLVPKSAGLKTSNDLQICAIGVPSEKNRKNLEKQFNMKRAEFTGSNYSESGNLMSILVTIINMLIKPNG